MPLLEILAFTAVASARHAARRLVAARALGGAASKLPSRRALQKKLHKNLSRAARNTMHLIIRCGSKSELAFFAQPAMIRACNLLLKFRRAGRQRYTLMHKLHMAFVKQLSQTGSRAVHKHAFDILRAYNQLLRVQHRLKRARNSKPRKPQQRPTSRPKPRSQPKKTFKKKATPRPPSPALMRIWLRALRGKGVRPETRGQLMSLFMKVGRSRARRELIRYVGKYPQAMSRLLVHKAWLYRHAARVKNFDARRRALARYSPSGKLRQLTRSWGCIYHSLYVGRLRIKADGSIVHK